MRTDYTNTYDEKGDMYGGSKIEGVVKKKYDREGKLKAIITKGNPISRIRPLGDTPLSNSPIVKFQ